MKQKRTQERLSTARHEERVMRTIFIYAACGSASRNPDAHICLHCQLIIRNNRWTWHGRSSGPAPIEMEMSDYFAWIRRIQRRSASTPNQPWPPRRARLSAKFIYSSRGVRDRSSVSPFCPVDRQECGRGILMLVSVVVSIQCTVYNFSVMSPWVAPTL